MANDSLRAARRAGSRYTDGRTYGDHGCGITTSWPRTSGCSCSSVTFISGPTPTEGADCERTVTAPNDMTARRNRGATDAGVRSSRGCCSSSWTNDLGCSNTGEVATTQCRGPCAGSTSSLTLGWTLRSFSWNCATRLASDRACYAAGGSCLRCQCNAGSSSGFVGYLGLGAYTSSRPPLAVAGKRYRLWIATVPVPLRGTGLLSEEGLERGEGWECGEGPRGRRTPLAPLLLQATVESNE